MKFRRIAVDRLTYAIYELAEPVYLASQHYPRTIWSHALAVARHAKDFARTLRGNHFVAEVAGLLHDIGAAKFGKTDHHITGAELATGILLKVGCPVRQIGAVAGAIYSHRASQDVTMKSVASLCVAAADAKDHFDNVGELWLVAEKDWGVVELERLAVLNGKLERDWGKTDSRIRELLNGTYERARQTLLKIANGQIKPNQRPIVRICGNGKPL